VSAAHANFQNHSTRQYHYATTYIQKHVADYRISRKYDRIVDYLPNITAEYLLYELLQLRIRSWEEEERNQMFLADEFVESCAFVVVVGIEQSVDTSIQWTAIGTWHHVVANNLINWQTLQTATTTHAQTLTASCRDAKAEIWPHHINITRRFTLAAHSSANNVQAEHYCLQVYSWVSSILSDEFMCSCRY